MIPSESEFFIKLNDFTESQVSFTLGKDGLPPANQVDIFEVNFEYILTNQSSIRFSVSWVMISFVMSVAWLSSIL